MKMISGVCHWHCDFTHARVEAPASKVNLSFDLVPSRLLEKFRFQLVYFGNDQNNYVPVVFIPSLPYPVLFELSEVITE